jgi:retron-type reverse transcriptase
MASLFTFEKIYEAYLDCRRKKRGMTTSLAFEVNAEENLVDLTRRLADRTYAPLPSFCFVAKNDKHREVFAANFRDRVVHHLLVRQLEKVWEPVFIHDSYACRKGKGTHAAVKRLQSFCLKVSKNRTRRAWFAQMDIRAFFPSIDRRIRLDIVLSHINNKELRWLTEAIIMHDPTQDPVFTCSSDKWRNVPQHKSLFTVPDGKGVPIGNLTSQFFANIYLNHLDQFIKHKLKARYYIRYVDDLVLLHEDRHKLYEWKQQIKDFLTTHLKLELHPNRQIVRPVSNGINFLGYVIRASHLLVRRRVVDNCKQSLASQITGMTKKTEGKVALVFPPDRYDKLYSTLNSYLGIFSHASCYHLTQSLFTRFPALNFLFNHKEYSAVKRWSIPFRPANLYTQFRFFRMRFNGLILFQVGNYFELFDKDALWAIKQIGMSSIYPRIGFYARCGVRISRLKSLLNRLQGWNVLCVYQSGYICGGIAQRIAIRTVLIGNG